MGGTTEGLPDEDLRPVYLVQGWVVSDKVFSRTHTILILVVAWVFGVAWMISLAVAARRMPDAVVARLADQTAASNITSAKITHR